MDHTSTDDGRDMETRRSLERLRRIVEAAREGGLDASRDMLVYLLELALTEMDDLEKVLEREG